MDFKERIKKGIDKFITKIKEIIGKSGAEGKILILIGGRGSGKTETIKNLCNEVKGKKYVFEFNKDGEFVELNDKDKKEYSNIKDCAIIEDMDNQDIEAGLYINEDFSKPTRDGEAVYLDLIKHTRHKGINIMIVTHTLNQIPRRYTSHNKLLIALQECRNDSAKAGDIDNAKKGICNQEGIIQSEGI